MKVWTTKGPIDRELLEVRDIVIETETSRDKVTEWYLDGELVRRDGWVSVLMPAEVELSQGRFMKETRGGSTSVGLSGIEIASSQASIGG